MSDQIKQIRQLLIQGKEYKALKALVEVLKSNKKGKELLNNAFLLQSRLEGIEAKFNQGITTHEKWEVSRNKIIKSTLDFLKRVEQILSVEDLTADKSERLIDKPVISNATFIHRLAQPEVVRKMAFYYLILWIVLGAWDTLFFQIKDASLLKQYYILGIGFQKYLADGTVVTWLNDFIGHLFAFGTVCLVVILDVTKTNLARISTVVMNEVNDLYRKYFYPFTFLVVGMIALTIFFNASYTTQQSAIQLWSVKISPKFLPVFIATNYFMLVLIPLVLGFFYYCFLLQVTTKEFKSFSTYSPFHGDKHFGLLWVGRSIFWGTLSFVVLMLLALILQLHLKNGELTFGIFIGTILFVAIVWYGAINPLKKLTWQLRIEKENLYESVKEEVRNNNRMLGKQSSTEDLNTVKLLLDASRENEKELLDLSILPITNKELIIGIGIIFLLLVLIVLQIA